MKERKIIPNQIEKTKKKNFTIEFDCKYVGAAIKGTLFAVNIRSFKKIYF